MGAPTALHEYRVAELESLAILAGFTMPFALPWRLRPDVIRACRRARSIFLGDAKATESPACTDTLARLRWYVRGVATLTPPVLDVTFALAVPPGAPTREWELLLVRALGNLAVFAEAPTTTQIGETAVVGVRTGVLRARPI